MVRLSRLLLVLLCSQAAFAEQYRPSTAPGWEEIIFAGHTRYQAGDDCVVADSRDAASERARKVVFPEPARACIRCFRNETKRGLVTQQWYNGALYIQF